MEPKTTHGQLVEDLLILGLWDHEDEDNTHSSIELVDSTTDTSEREFCGETTEDAEFEIIS